MRLSETCRIWTRTETSDGHGGVAPAYTENTVDIPCARATPTGKSRIGRLAEQLGFEQVAIVPLLDPAVHTIALGDRIAVGGEIFTVGLVRSAPAVLGAHHLNLFLTREGDSSG